MPQALAKSARPGLVVRPPANQDSELRLARRARLLELRYGGLGGAALLDVAVNDIFPGRIAVVSSFGTESAVLLDLVAQVNPATPVIFLETGKHFRSEEHTSELQSLMRISYAVFCLKKKK